VGGHEHGEAALAPDVVDGLPHERGRFRVELARGLVGQKKRGPVHERARHGHALLLAAGELARAVVRPVGKPHVREELVGAGGRRGRGEARFERRQRHVLAGGERGVEVEALEDEADAVQPPAIALVARQTRRGLAVEENLARGGDEKETRHGQQRGLSAARGARKRRALAGFERHGNAAQGLHGAPAAHGREAVVDVPKRKRGHAQRKPQTNGKLLRNVPPAIDARGLGKRFGARTALRDVDLLVQEGETVALLGQNGSGKTTVLRILAAATPATHGAALVAGFDVAREPRRVRERVGFVPQEAALHDELSARESLVLAGRLHGLSSEAAFGRAAEILGSIGLAPRADSAAGELSGGMRARLNVGLALVHDPPVLLLDEPTTGLDPGAGREFRALLERLRSRRRTVLLSTHDLAMASELCGRFVVLVDGRVASDGAWEQVQPALAEAYRGGLVA